jgi:hypothetical protein
VPESPIRDAVPRVPVAMGRHGGQAIQCAPQDDDHQPCRAAGLCEQLAFLDNQYPVGADFDFCGIATPPRLCRS